MPITISIDNPTAAEIQALSLAASGLAGSNPAAGAGSSSSSTSATGSTGPTGSTGTGSTGTGAQTPPVASQPILHMPANIAPDTDYSVGSGPDQLAFQIGLEPTSPSAIFDVLIDGVGVAQGLVVTTKAESIGGQRITINGNWGPGPHTIEQVYTDPLAGNGTFNNLVQYNLAPCYANGGYDSRGSMSVNATSVFLTKGHIINWTTQPLNATAAVGGAAAVGPTLSTVAATINGTAKSDTLANLLTATLAGQELDLPSGTIIGTGTIPNACTIKGAGQGKTVLDCTGLTPAQSKGVLVPSVAGTTISNMTIKGAAVSDDNGAAVRDAGTGIGFTLDTVEVTGCQDGILTFPSNVALKNCYFHDNGAGDGLSHEIYIGGDTANTGTVTNTIVAAGVKATHALKSRAGTTTVSGCTLTGSLDTTGNVAGSVVDIPDGGICNISDTTISTSINQGNDLFLGYAMESALNQAIGTTVTLTNVVFNDQTGTGGMIQNGTKIPGATLVLQGCTYKGTKAPQITGFASVTGTIAKAA